MKRTLLVVVVVLIGAVSAVVYAQNQEKPTRALAAGPNPSAVGIGGRFQMVTPPVAGADSLGYNNFLWVLDTQTGKVNAFRLVNMKDDKDKSIGLAYEQLPFLGVGSVK